MRAPHLPSVHRLSLVAPFVLAAVACGGSTLGGGAHDSGAPEGSTEDAGNPSSDGGGPTADAGGPSDAAGHDGHAGKGTVPIASGDYLVLWGVTGDGYAVYSTGSSNPSFYAVSLSGGAPVAIAQASGGGYAFAVVQQNVAFVYTNPDQYYVGPVTAWTSGGGAHQLSASSYYLTGASSDSSHIAYLDNVTEQSDGGLAIVGDLYGANADGSGAKLLQSGVSGWYIAGGGGSSSCYTYFSFAGGYAVLFACAQNGGATTEQVWSYPSSGWQGSEIVANATSLSGFDNAGTQALLTTSAGLQSVPLGGGAATTIDPTGAAGLFTSDGKNVVYVTTMGALARSPVANPSPQQLVASGVEGLWAISPDDGSVLLFESYDQQTGLTDLYVASAATPGNATSLVSAQTAMVGGPNSYMAGSAFSADSSHALFWSGVAIPMGQQYFPVIGTLQAGATGAAGMPAQLGKDSNAAWALGGSAVAFADNLAMVGNSPATFDIAWADTAKATPATTVVKGAIASTGGAPFYVTSSHDRVVYVGSEPADAGDAGSVLDLYTAPLP